MKGIMEESLLAWTLNGQRQTPFLCSEGDAEALLLGHMVASGLVEEPEKVQSVSFENGYIEFENYNRSNRAKITFLNGKDAVITESDGKISPLVYEIEDMEESVTGNYKMHLDFTVDVMDIMTETRYDWGVKYPEEK